MPKPNVDTLLDLIERSGLVEKDRLDAFIARLKTEGNGQLPTDVDEVAARVVAENLVTQWQSDRLLEGTGKGLRHVKIRSLAEANRPPVRALLAAALVRRRSAA